MTSKKSLSHKGKTMDSKNRTEHFIGLFLISLAMLLFEISLTRIFSFILFSNYAFMIISTAIFGFGLSGVLLAVFPKILERFKIENILLFCSVMFSVTVLFSFVVIKKVPLQMADLKNVKNLMSLGIYYVSLIIPFTFGGFVIGALFTRFSDNIPKLYFYDLLGAGLGCLLTVPFFINFGALGTVYAVSLMGIISGIIFSFRSSKFAKIATPVLLIVWGVLFPAWMNQEIIVHENKRSYRNDQQSKVFEYSKWSSLSKIDIAPGPRSFFKRLWIDGGTNESALISFDGKFKTDYLAGMDKLLIAFPYLLKKSPEVAIIGSSGGREVLLALNHDPKHITAIEMDPTICEIVSKTYADYIGNIFSDPRVTLVCDEGRSYIRRSVKQFDIIHQVNNFTPIAMASGAINLSESYLLSKEAFKEYLDHLTDEGMLVLNRHNTFKIAVIAREVLLAVDLNPSKNIVVIQGEDRINNGFLMKKTPFNQEEIETLKRLASERNLEMLYYPGINDPGNWYVDLLKNNNSEKFQNLSGLNLESPTDNKPFFEHIGAIGKIDVSDPKLPGGIAWVDAQKKVKRRLPIEDLILLAIFLEASFFSLIFIFGPLLLFNKKGISSVVELRVLAYFFAIGIAFILVEICLMQQFVLFLGVPVYAIAVVLFSLLSGTGVGSLIAGSFKMDVSKALKNVYITLFITLLVSNFFITKIIDLSLGFDFWPRVIISIILIFPLGILMGMPFPLGMKTLSQVEKRLIPWAWGINGYATVIGTVAAIAFARMVGFQMVLFGAAFIYISGFFAIRKIKPS